MRTCAELHCIEEWDSEEHSVVEDDIILRIGSVTVEDSQYRTAYYSLKNTLFQHLPSNYISEQDPKQPKTELKTGFGAVTENLDIICEKIDDYSSGNVAAEEIAISKTQSPLALDKSDCKRPPQIHDQKLTLDSQSTSSLDKLRLENKQRSSDQLTKISDIKRSLKMQSKQSVSDDNTIAKTPSNIEYVEKIGDEGIEALFDFPTEKTNESIHTGTKDDEMQELQKNFKSSMFMAEKESVSKDTDCIIVDSIEELNTSQSQTLTDDSETQQITTDISSERGSSEDTDSSCKDVANENSTFSFHAKLSLYKANVKIFVQNTGALPVEECKIKMLNKLSIANDGLPFPAHTSLQVMIKSPDQTNKFSFEFNDSGYDVNGNRVQGKSIEFDPTSSIPDKNKEQKKFSNKMGKVSLENNISVFDKNISNKEFEFSDEIDNTNEQTDIKVDDISTSGDRSSHDDLQSPMKTRSTIQENFDLVDDQSGGQRLLNDAMKRDSTESDKVPDLRTDEIDFRRASKAESLASPNTTVNNRLQEKSDASKKSIDEPEPTVSALEETHEQSDFKKKSIAEAVPTISNFEEKCEENDFNRKSICRTEPTASALDITHEERNVNRKSIDETEPTLSALDTTHGESDLNKKSITEMEPTVSALDTTNGESDLNKKSITEMEPTVSALEETHEESGVNRKSIDEAEPTVSALDATHGESDLNKKSITEMEPTVSALEETHEESGATENDTLQALQSLESDAKIECTTASGHSLDNDINDIDNLENQGKSENVIQRTSFGADSTPQLELVNEEENCINQSLSTPIDNLVSENSSIESLDLSKERHSVQRISQILDHNLGELNSVIDDPNKSNVQDAIPFEIPKISNNDAIISDDSVQNVKINEAAKHVEFFVNDNMEVESNVESEEEISSFSSADVPLMTEESNASHFVINIDIQNEFAEPVSIKYKCYFDNATFFNSNITVKSTTINLSSTFRNSFDEVYNSDLLHEGTENIPSDHYGTVDANASRNEDAPTELQDESNSSFSAVKTNNFSRASLEDSDIISFSGYSEIPSSSSFMSGTPTMNELSSIPVWQPRRVRFTLRFHYHE